MAEVECNANPESGWEIDSNSEPRLSWDSSVKAIPIGRGWDAEPCVLDWYGTNEADLLISSGGGPRGRMVWLYRPIAESGPGLPPCYDAGVRVPSLDGLRCLCPLPNGGPNRFDLVAIRDGGLVLLPNEGTANEPAFGPRVDLDCGFAPEFASHQVVQMFAVDWDHDGLTDLLLGVHDLTGYWPRGDQLPPEQEVGLNQRGCHPGYDNEGLWRGRAPVGRIFWLRNEGRAGAPKFSLQPEITGDSGPLDIGLHPAPLAVSWGGRGSLELLLSDNRGLLRVYRNFGGQLPPVLMEPRTLACGGAHVVLHDDRIALTAADIDGDGRVELIYGTSDGRVFSVHSGPSRNEAKEPEPVPHRIESVLLGGHASVTAADLDGDQDLDIVFGDSAGRLHYLKDLGQGDDHRYALPETLEAGGTSFRVEPGPDGILLGPAAHNLGFARPTLADWLEHGRLDLVVTGAGGDVLLLPNNGSANSPRFGSPMVIRFEGAPLIVPPRVQVAVANWISPDTPALITLDLQGILCAFPKLGTNEVGRPIPIVDHLGRLIRLDGSFGLSGRCSIWAGPWTGAGRIDLLIGLPRGNRHVVPAVTGLPLESVEALPTILLLENHGRGSVIPRPLRFNDGRPVVIGHDGCSPLGVPRSGQALPDLLVGSDDGTLTWISRQDLRW